jgi:hypothetical protein
LHISDKNAADVVVAVVAFKLQFRSGNSKKEGNNSSADISEAATTVSFL